MKILICFSGLFGGADLLLERYYQWLTRQSYTVEKVVIAEETDWMQRKDFYGLVILPSSQMNDLLSLKRCGYGFGRILIWIMGMGAFRDSYYNPSRDFGIEGVFNKVLKREADRMLRCLYQSRSICFTDEVGMGNTFCGTNIDYKSQTDANLIPIAIAGKLKREWKKTEEAIRLCWIGRVSKDFKLIPLLHLLEDIEQCVIRDRQKLSLMVVGMGNGLEELKGAAKSKHFPICFVEEVTYARLGVFLSEHADLLIAMGTSALDGAKYGCPSVVITPVRPGEREEVSYRWIFESKGFSLGEYPENPFGPEQIKKELACILREYAERDDLSERSYEYAENFDEEKVFAKLQNRELPQEMTKEMWRHITFFACLKKIKKLIKRI